MRNLFIFLLLLVFNTANAQIKNNGYNNLTWSQSKEQIRNLSNCNSNQTGAGFEICEFQSKDSIFIGKYKYNFISIRFFQNKLSEIQFDIAHKDIANIIAELTIQYGKPIIKEKNELGVEGEEATIGYVWELGDTHMLIINDGKLSPSICVLSSIKIKKTYPPNTLSLEQLIFE